AGLLRCRERRPLVLHAVTRLPGSRRKRDLGAWTVPEKVPVSGFSSLTARDGGRGRLIWRRSLRSDWKSPRSGAIESPSVITGLKGGWLRYDSGRAGRRGDSPGPADARAGVRLAARRQGELRRRSRV